MNYEIDGETYTAIVKECSSSWNIGDEIEIHYDIDNPQNINVSNMQFVLLAFPVIGLETLIFGISNLKIKRNEEAIY